MVLANLNKYSKNIPNRNFNFQALVGSDFLYVFQPHLVKSHSCPNKEAASHFTCHIFPSVPPKWSNGVSTREICPTTFGICIQSNLQLVSNRNSLHVRAASENPKRTIIMMAWNFACFRLMDYMNFDRRIGKVTGHNNSVHNSENQIISEFQKKRDFYL